MIFAVIMVASALVSGYVLASGYEDVPEPVVSGSVVIVIIAAGLCVSSLSMVNG